MKIFKIMSEKRIDSLSPIAISVLLLGLFTLLFVRTSKISDAVYVVLVTLSIFTGFGIYFRKTISRLDFKNMSFDLLGETKKVKSEIDQVALSLAKIIATLSAHSTGTWLNRKKLNDQIEKLLSTLSASSQEKNQILELPRIVEKFMKDPQSITTKERGKYPEIFPTEEKSD